MAGFALLPAAITMVAGPQIISAVVLATSRQAKRCSMAFLVGVSVAVVIGTIASLWLVRVLQGAASRTAGSSAETWLSYVFAGLLALVALRSFCGRKSAEPPKWLTGLQSAEPRGALRLGFLLFLFMPTDVAMMLSVAAYLTKNDLALWHSAPFFLLTMLLISLPLLTYLVLGNRAEQALPRVRDWMNTYSWAINIAICGYFIYSILS
jgi:threonine/homoserine/homoserine lactone efflux protein